MEELYMKLTSPESEGLTDEEFEEYKRLTTESTLVERKVLKVGNSQPQMPMDQNMGVSDPNMGGEMTMGDGMSDNMMDPNMDNQGGSEFDTNFDAGVEADEDEDPKKYIQQLTGKLSQELGKYNNELGEPDIELSKYVGGMIVKQVAKNLDDSGKKELIKKINTTEGGEDENLEDASLGDENLETDNIDDVNLQSESYVLNKKDISKLFEDFNVTNSESDDNLNINKEVKTKNSSKPFIAPKFKR